MKLYEISEEIEAVTARLEEPLTEEEADALLTELSALADAEQDKVTAYGYVIRNAEAAALIAKREADHFAAKARSQSNKAAYLKRVLLDYLERHGRDEVTDGKIKVRRCANGGAQPFRLLIPAHELPAQLREVAYTPKRREILFRLDELEQSGVVERLPRGHHVRVG